MRANLNSKLLEAMSKGKYQRVVFINFCLFYYNKIIRLVLLWCLLSGMTHSHHVQCGFQLPSIMKLKKIVFVIYIFIWYLYKSPNLWNDNRVVNLFYWCRRMNQVLVDTYVFLLRSDTNHSDTIVATKQFLRRHKFVCVVTQHKL